jgi:hypothetical protein
MLSVMMFLFARPGPLHGGAATRRESRPGWPFHEMSGLVAEEAEAGSASYVNVTAI